MEKKTDSPETYKEKDLDMIYRELFEITIWFFNYVSTIFFLYILTEYSGLNSVQRFYSFLLFINN